jgi:uncharacterized membrane protein
METPKSAESRSRFDLASGVGTILAAGILTSLLLLLTGLLWQWLATGDPVLHDALPRTSIARYIAGEIAASVHRGLNPTRLVNFGIIVLLLTPYLRVALSLGYFIFIERNGKYVAITGFVLVVLSYSLFLR